MFVDFESQELLRKKEQTFHLVACYQVVTVGG